jgi:CheY-like chemotaxis protein/HPt (histidine-containing phosphotransfer) domain-containing protein
MSCQLVSPAGSTSLGHFDVAVVDAHLSADSGLVNALLAAQVPTIVVTLIGDKAAKHWWGSLRQKRTIGPLKNAALKTLLQELLETRAESTPVPAPQPATSSVHSGTLAARMPLRILVTDDNVINQKVAARLLQQFGYAADIASNGMEALTALEKKAYDLVFMDMQMPGMDGLEATRRIRAIEQSTARQRVKIIAMTANAMLGDRERCLTAGMDDYLAKPVRPEALQAALEKWGNRPDPSAPPCVAPAESAVPSARTNGGEASGAVREPAFPSAEAAEIIDFDRLLEFAGGSRTSLIEITDLYLQQTTEQLDSIQSAVEQEDAAGVARHAHSSAGASGVCGVVLMEALFRRAEQLGKNHRIPEAAEILIELRAQFERVKVCLLNSRQNLPLS